MATPLRPDGAKKHSRVVHEDHVRLAAMSLALRFARMFIACMKPTARTLAQDRLTAFGILHP